VHVHAMTDRSASGHPARGGRIPVSHIYFRRPLHRER
jgi:hypothetical protein